MIVVPVTQCNANKPDSDRRVLHPSRASLRAACENAGDRQHLGSVCGRVHATCGHQCLDHIGVDGPMQRGLTGIVGSPHVGPSIHQGLTHITRSSEEQWGVAPKGVGVDGRAPSNQHAHHVTIGGDSQGGRVAVTGSGVHTGPGGH